MFVKYNQNHHMRFFMADPTDPTQGKANLQDSIEVRYSRPTTTLPNGFGTLSVTVYQISSETGWYECVLPGSIFTPTNGEIIVMCKHDDAIPWRTTYQILDALPGELTDAMIAEIVAKIFRTTMEAIEDSSEGTAITTTNLSLYKAVMSLVGKVALISTTKRIYQTDETTTALDLTMTSGQGPASPFISQEP